MYNTEENVKLRCQFWFVDCHIENWINKYREKNWQGHKKKSDLQLINGKQFDKWEIYTTHTGS